MTHKAVPFRRVAKFLSGGTPSKGRPEYWAGTIPWVSPKDMGEAHLDDAADHISNAALEGSATKLVGEGTILAVARSGILARKWPIALVQREVAFNQDIKAIVVDRDKLDPEYAFWWLRSCEPDVLHRGVKKGATVHSLLANFVEDLLVPLPPIDEQRRIVDILNRTASIERLRRQASAHLRDFIPALFLKMFGDPIENPMGWQIKELGSLVVDGARNGLSPSRTGSFRGQVLTLSAITRGAFDPAAIKEGTFDHVIPDEQTVKTSRFLLCRGNGNPDLVGRGHFPTVDMRGVAFPDTIISLEFRPDCLRPEFVEALWATRFIREQVERAAKTTNGTYKINQGSLLGFSIPVPSLEKQEAFARLAKAAQSRAHLANSANDLAAGLSRSLLDKMLGADRS